MDLSKSMRVAMAQRGVKNKDIAKALNVTAPNVSLWRTSGNISQANIERLCEFFGLQVSEFIAIGEGD